MWEKIQAIMPDYRLLNVEGCRADKERACFVYSGAEIAGLAADGALPESVYAAVSGLSDADIDYAIGKCRFVAESPEELRRIDRIAAGRNRDGQLASVGLFLIPTAYDDGRRNGIREADLPALTEEIRKLSAISVRGCFIQGSMEGLHGKELGRYFRNCYELA